MLPSDASSSSITTCFSPMLGCSEVSLCRNVATWAGVNSMYSTCLAIASTSSSVGTGKSKKPRLSGLMVVSILGWVRCNSSTFASHQKSAPGLRSRSLASPETFVGTTECLLSSMVVRGKALLRVARHCRHILGGIRVGCSRACMNSVRVKRVDPSRSKRSKMSRTLSASTQNPNFLTETSNSCRVRSWSLLSSIFAKASSTLS
mmetsp:Transcript_58746/g.135478  ORF Transcript_58746/g.135478 Transcript_58746/m.135478 type:complete len:204 (-) Transcript_58746:1112-1723(-)